MESKKNGNVSRKMDPENIDLFGSVNVFGNDEFGDTERNKKNLMFNIEKYDLGQNYQDEIEEDNNIPKNISLHQSIQETKNEVKKEKFNKKAESDMKQSVMVFSSKDKDDSLFEQQMIAKIKEQKNKKTKPTKIKFKKPQALNQSTIKFGNYGSIGDKTYKTNNLSQSMMIFTNKNNNKAKKGTDKTKKIDLKKDK